MGPFTGLGIGVGATFGLSAGQNVWKAEELWIMRHDDLFKIIKARQKATKFADRNFDRRERLETLLIPHENGKLELQFNPVGKKRIQGEEVEISQAFGTGVFFDKGVYVLRGVIDRLPLPFNSTLDANNVFY